MINDLALRWSVTVLFGISIVGYVYLLVAQHGRWASTVDHLLHLAMSLAMVEMAWRAAIDLPNIAPIAFFLLAAVWFTFAARRVSCGIPDRLANAYNAVMMAAMAWMYAVMDGSLPGQAGHSSAHLAPATLGMEMPAMDTPGAEMSLAGPEPAWIVAVNWLAAVGFAIATVYWVYRYFTVGRMDPVQPRVQPVHPSLAQLGLLCQAFIAAGVAIMFGLMM